MCCIQLAPLSKLCIKCKPCGCRWTSTINFALTTELVVSNNPKFGLTSTTFCLGPQKEAFVSPKSLSPRGQGGHRPLARHQPSGNLLATTHGTPWHVSEESAQQISVESARAAQPAAAAYVRPMALVCFHLRLPGESVDSPAVAPLGSARPPDMDEKRIRCSPETSTIFRVT